jgi:hypothetical protein
MKPLIVQKPQNSRFNIPALQWQSVGRTHRKKTIPTYQSGPDPWFCIPPLPILPETFRTLILDEWPSQYIPR